MITQLKEQQKEENSTQFKEKKKIGVLQDLILAKKTKFKFWLILLKMKFRQNLTL